MLKERVEFNALNDYELYHNDFKLFSEATKSHLKITGVFEVYWCTLVFKNWKEGVNHTGCDNLDSIFNELHQDVSSSYYLASMGLYRTSNMHLRSLIELSFQLLYFFDHPIEFEKWKVGEFVIKHEKLKDYLKEYPAFSDNALKGKINTLVEQISKLWKDFSKHIHAESLVYFQTQKVSVSNNGFDLADFGKWKSSFVRLVKKINELFMLFFSEKYKLFPSTNRDLLTLS
ncbi:DUF5677 domain-containing protein [Vreelandella boliviensis]|uniref:Hemerythrin-like domain-containing protein n=1 Tax=Vreelandella boliviensis LC1 TaxID=1072583 RepID=A0A265E2P6_9GAMM|nr:DUF5677 domain-containing protein [Halomonas boliviensis]EHJ93613.1 hypothetical protein KUC_0562 [Halomonas boliviensis LC1]OZT75873.1 hypothetical protein CE457_01205 [Halomonas boliviensis LC1]